MTENVNKEDTGLSALKAALSFLDGIAFAALLFIALAILAAILVGCN